MDDGRTNEAWETPLKTIVSAVVSTVLMIIPLASLWVSQERQTSGGKGRRLCVLRGTREDSREELTPRSFDLCEFWHG